MPNNLVRLDGDYSVGLPVQFDDGSRFIIPVVATVDTSGNYVAGGGGGGGNASAADVQGSGTLDLTTLNATYVIALTNARSVIGSRISGLTGSGATVTVERSNDGGTTWTTANTTEGSTTATLSATLTANGQPRINAAGATNIRFRTSVVGTGSASIAYNATNAVGGVFLTGNLPQTNGSIGGVSGDTASGTADQGNPVKIGGLANDGNPTQVANNARKDIWTNRYGAQVISGSVLVGDGSGSTAGNSIVGLDGVSRPLAVINYNLNAAGTAISLSRGDVSGTYVVGPAAEATALTGNPQRMGGSDGTNIRTLSVTTGGALNVGSIASALPAGTNTLGGVNLQVGSTALVALADNADGIAAVSTATGLRVQSRGTQYNGSTWDRLRKPSIFSRIASTAATGSPTSVKTTAGDVSLFWGFNGAAVTYVQFYNKASAPTLGTDTPVATYQVAASAPFNIQIPNGGAYFGTGIAIAFTTDAAGTTAAAAGAVTAFQLFAA